MAKPSLAETLKYGSSAPLIKRSQYLEDMLRSNQQAGANVKSPFELGTRLLTEALLSRANNKAQTEALTAIKGEKDRRAQALIQGLQAFGQPAQQTQAPAQPQPMQQMPTAPVMPVEQKPLPAPKFGSTSPIGLRQNNPGNLRDTPTPWQGAVGAQGGFEQFDTPENGIRALARNLQTYGKRGLNTVEGIIGRWAPPNENNTGAYIGTVAQALGVDPRQPLDMNDPQTLAKLSTAIIQHENGQQPFAPEQIMSGVQAAFGQQAAPPPQQAQPVAQQAAPQPVAAPPPVAGSSPAPMGGGRITPQQMQLVQGMLADPVTYDQGMAYAQQLMQEAAKPVEYNSASVNGLPARFNPRSGQYELAELPQGAQSQTMTAEQLGIPAPPGTVFSRDPTGKITQVSAPPAGFQAAGPAGQLAPIRGGPQDPTAGGNLIEGEAKLRAEYAKATQDAAEARAGAQKVVAAAQDATGASDVALIFGLMKTFDPGSTVREGEFATAQNTGSIPERIVGMYERALKGERLTPNQRQQFVNTALSQYGVYQQKLDQDNERFRGLAQSYGYDPTRIVRDFPAVEAPKPKAPVSGAQQGQDGQWYIEDPDVKGSFLRIGQDQQGRNFVVTAKRGKVGVK